MTFNFRNPGKMYSVCSTCMIPLELEIELERNDLWLNVKGNYIFFKGKIILNLD